MASIMAEDGTMIVFREISRADFTMLINSARPGVILEDWRNGVCS